MQVILTTTSEAPQLHPGTTTVPTAMMPIANRPVMALAVELLARAGLKQITICLAGDGRHIATYFGSGHRWGVQITYATSSAPEHALFVAGRGIAETTLILPAAALLDLDIDAALAYHQDHGGPATAILAPLREGHAPAVVRHNLVRQATTAAGLSSAQFCATGAYIVEPEALRSLSPAPINQREGLLAALVAGGVRVQGHVMRGYWNPLESFAEYQEAQRVVLHSAYAAAWPERPALEPDLPRIRYPLIEGRQIAPGVWAGPNRTVARTARFTPPVVIGEHSQIGAGAELGPNVVVGVNVIIDDEATVQNSTILDSTYVGRLTHSCDRVIDRATMVDIHTSVQAQVVDAFLLAEVPAPRRPSGPRGLVGRIRAWLRRQRPTTYDDDREIYEPIDRLSGA